MKKILLLILLLNLATTVLGELPGHPAGNEHNHPRQKSASEKVEIRRGPYRGWEDAIFLKNGTAEVIIVPAIGRIMEFHFPGENGPFWENPAMFGKAPSPTSTEWGNFGGDKTWPAPQAEWGKITGRQWPPPPAFDSLRVDDDIIGGDVELVSPADPAYGVRTLRRIHLDPKKPVMIITTRYEKLRGAPRKIGVWTITQLQEPLGVFIPLPPPANDNQNTSDKDGYVRMEKGDLPANLKVEDLPKGGARLLSLTRDPKTASKIGTHGGTLVWVGEHNILRIDSPRVAAGAEYPDQGSSAEVYTSPDPLQYVELEMLGPLSDMKPGNHIERTTTYTLMHRTGKGVREEGLSAAKSKNSTPR